MTTNGPKTPGARSGAAGPGESARPDHHVPGPREDPAPRTAASAVASAAVPTSRPALTLRRRPFLTWLLDLIGRPA